MAYCWIIIIQSAGYQLQPAIAAIEQHTMSNREEDNVVLSLGFSSEI